MSDDIFDGLTDAQLAALGRIAANEPAGATKATLAPMEKRGLIAYEHRRARDGFGEYVWKVPYMPDEIYARWRERIGKGKRKARK